MATKTVTPLSERLLLTELPEETPHRVACVLRFLAAHDAKEMLADPDHDIEFGRHILLRDLATALDYCYPLLASRFEASEVDRAGAEA